MFTVYHADKPTFSNQHPKFSLDDRTGFTAVAIVEAYDLEEVFMLTNNHDDKKWQDNPQVKSSRPDCRSTSVGDVVVGNEGAFRCEVYGWSKIED